jgi:16S rRNA (adenine1518-N6/adenine1519-N6)-dimethyltransferase
MPRVFSQNFLINENIVRKIADQDNKKCIAEIGSGNYVLTKRLLDTTKILLAIEIDTKFKEKLKYTSINKDKKYKILWDDALYSDENKILNKRYTLMSNLPYNVSTKILLKCSLIAKRINIVLMLQYNVVKKILKHVSKKINMLIKILFRTKITMSVANKNFIPIPKVYSSVIRISLKENFINNYKILKLLELFNLVNAKRVKKYIYKKRINNINNLIWTYIQG